MSKVVLAESQKIATAVVITNAPTTSAALPTNNK
jgi:hypothetical protein